MGWTMRKLKKKESLIRGKKWNTIGTYIRKSGKVSWIGSFDALVALDFVREVEVLWCEWVVLVEERIGD